MRPSFWHYLHIVVQFSIACGGQSSVLARCGLTRRTFSPSRRTTWGQYYIVVEASMVGDRLFSTCTVRLPTDHALPCPRIVAMCARPDCPCASWARRQVGISSTDICSGLVEARRGATGRRWHGEQQCGWDLSCHLTFTHTFTLASASCSRSRHTPRTERSCPHAHVLAHAHAVAHAHPRPHLSHFIPRRSSSSSQPRSEVVRSLVRVAAILQH